VCEKLGAKEVEYIDLSTWGYIHPGFVGSAIVSATYWEHDVFDPEGKFLRNLVGLAAVKIERTGGTLLQAVPGDQAAGSVAEPILGAFAFSGLQGPLCPGLDGAPAIPDCPPQIVEHSGNISLTINDQSTTRHTISMPSVPRGCKVTDVAIVHGSNSDLTARLVHDAAAETTTGGLFTGICSATSNIVTTLDDDEAVSIGSVCPPIGGRYATQARSLRTFNGTEAAGDWTIEVDDTVAGNTGLLLNWSVELHTARP
jgi:hypothetical protein